MKDIWSAMEDGEIVVGHWVASGSPTMVELFGHSGADVVAIDCEHGPLSPYGDGLEACIRAAYAADVAPIVRIPAQDGAQVSRAADLGAKGVIVPHVNTAEQLRRMLSHVKFPPVGNRGCSSNVRAARYGWLPWPEFLEMTNTSVEVIPLLEEPSAFECLDEILEVDGLRAVAIGPLDLAARLGGVGNADAAAKVRDLLERLVSACDARGISVIDGAWDLDSVRQKVEAGCRGIMFSGDTWFVAQALREQMTQVRRVLPGR